MCSLHITGSVLISEHLGLPADDVADLSSGRFAATEDAAFGPL